MVGNPKRDTAGPEDSTTMPKKPQNLSLVTNIAGGYGGGPNKRKYTLTLHNSKHTQGGKLLRNGLQQRHHHKALEGIGEVVGVHLKTGPKAAAATHKTSVYTTRTMEKSGNGREVAKAGNNNDLGGGMANAIKRAQTNRLLNH